MKRLAPITCLLFAIFAATSCAEFGELGDLFEIVVFEESDDPELRRTAEVLNGFRQEREVEDALSLYADTGDPRHLEAARELRPNDTGVRAYDVVLATLGGDAAEIEAAKRALALAESQRLAALSTDQAEFEPTPEQLRRNVLGEILVAQTNLAGGSLTEEWGPPGPDAPPATRQVFEDYCATRQELLENFEDDLQYLPANPCPQ